MYSQKAQVAIMQVGGAPMVLPKEPTERLKLVTAAVDAITESPPKRTHTRTTKGGASTYGSMQDPIPDPDLLTGSGEPKSGWGTLPAQPADPAGAGPDAPVAVAECDQLAVARQLIAHTQGVLSSLQAAPAAAARSGDCVLSALPVGHAENGPSQEVPGEVRTPSSRLASRRRPHNPPALLQDPDVLAADAEGCRRGDGRGRPGRC